jgi:hypothetical protein
MSTEPTYTFSMASKPGQGYQRKTFPVSDICCRFMRIEVENARIGYAAAMQDVRVDVRLARS